MPVVNYTKLPDSFSMPYWASNFAHTQKAWAEQLKRIALPLGRYRQFSDVEKTRLYKKAGRKGR